MIRSDLSSSRHDDDTTATAVSTATTASSRNDNDANNNNHSNHSTRSGSVILTPTSTRRIRQQESSLSPSKSLDDHTDETWDASSGEGSSSNSSSHSRTHMDHHDDDDDEEAAGNGFVEIPLEANDNDDLHPKIMTPTAHHHWIHDLMWLSICFVGIMASFVAYGILLEYATTGDRKLHELSFLFVTSVLATITAWTGRTIKKEAITDIPANRFFVLGLMSLGSTFCAIRALRYVIFPIQVLARSCKPVPVLLIGSLLGKKYPRRKYISVFLIVCGVAMFMGGGNILKGGSDDSADSGDSGDSSDIADSWANNTTTEIPMDELSSSSSSDINDGGNDTITPLHQQIFGVALLTASLFFDGGTGAFEDKLMSVHSVEPFDLMFKFQLSKSLLAAFALIVFNQYHMFVEMVQQAGFYIIALGMCSAIGQVFIFITIAKFGALTCSLMSLTRKVTTLTASIVIYDHDLTGVQLVGLLIALGAMMMNFFRPKEESHVVALTGSTAADKAVKGVYSSVPTTASDEDHHHDDDDESDNELHPAVVPRKMCSV